MDAPSISPRAAGLLEQFMSQLPVDYPDRQPETVRVAAADLIGELLEVVGDLDARGLHETQRDPAERIARTGTRGVLSALEARAARRDGTFDAVLSVDEMERTAGVIDTYLRSAAGAAA